MCPQLTLITKYEITTRFTVDHFDTDWTIVLVDGLSHARITEQVFIKEEIRKRRIGVGIVHL